MCLLSRTPDRTVCALPDRATPRTMWNDTEREPTGDEPGSLRLMEPPRPCRLVRLPPRVTLSLIHRLTR
jgi:hypothetical protein